MRDHRLAVKLVVCAFAFVSWAIPSGVAAQPVNPVVRVLITSADPRERAQAALTLGSINARGARDALEHALSDESPAVRTSAASTLGLLGDPAALAALRSHAQDPDENTRGAVARAIVALETSPDWVHARFVVWPGLLVDHATNNPARVEAVRSGIIRALRGRPTIALRLGAYPPGVAQRVRSGQLKAFSLEGGIGQMGRTVVGAGTVLRATVSLVLVMEPIHAIMGSLEGAASARLSATDMASPQAAALIETRIIDAAVAGALQDLEGTLSSIRR